MKQAFILNTMWIFLFAMSAFSVEQTVVLQLGLNGYAGTTDTWVSTYDWGSPDQYLVNYGQNESLFLSRDGGENPIIQFDLSSIPANSLILEARLELYNITASSGGPASYDRRVRLYQILRDWDEGNQVNSPIDASGKHGATGDHAFDYFTGEGTDVPWNDRGMQSGTDFSGNEESYADVQDEGWYGWDLTELVRSWVRGETTNFGLVLRDGTGYEEGNQDWREFRSSQFSDAGFRPKLTLRFNPDVPFADAGPDQEILNWDGSSIQLDGSGSQDRPGGNNSTLSYSWQILQAAHGSSLSGVIGTGVTLAFLPDAAGEWQFQLTVTNEILEVATDTVTVRVLSIPNEHPRIYLTPAILAQLQARAVPGNSRWTQLQAEANEPDASMHAKALVGLVTGNDTLCDQAVSAAITLMNTAGDWSTKSGDIALVFDWCHHRLSAGQITDFVNYFNAWGQDQLDSPFSSDTPGWGNYWPRYGYSFALIGLASFGDNARAQEWFDQFRQVRFEQNDLPLLDRIAEGGAWPEGMIYDWIANPPRVRALEAWRTVTGENLFQSTPWFQQRLPYLLLHRWPGLAAEWGNEYHPYPSIGDTERNRGSIANYDRIMALILLDRFPSGTSSAQLQAYLSAGTTANTDAFLYHEEFLWYNPDLPQETPSLLTHFAQGTGTVFMRSGWPSGAVDTDTSATHLTFQCGDHFTYHQHYDQNSFTLFKYSDLAVDSGVYSGDGLSYHDRDYYVRTIAHNTLIVYNPVEDFSSSRPGAETVDGGQRSLYPASRSPMSVEYFDQHGVQYETGNILHFEDRPEFTYMLGDATPAYNNSGYNQAMDTPLTGNTAKLSRFHRSLVYLRPSATYNSPDDYVVILDRVGVTSTGFSGPNTKLLFHILNEPAVNGTAQAISGGETLFSHADRFESVHEEGRLVMRTLWPQDVNMRKVGSRGEKAFWVFDQNVDWHWDEGELQPRPTNDFESEPYGEWRIELEPSDTDLDHNFLSILVPSSSAASAEPDMVRIDGGNVLGAHILDPNLNRVCIFSSSLDGSAPVGPISYSLVPTSESLHMLFDLDPNQSYDLDITYPSGDMLITLTPDVQGALTPSDQGVLQFIASPDGLCLALLHAQLPSWPEVNILQLVGMACP